MLDYRQGTDISRKDFVRGAAVLAGAAAVAQAPSTALPSEAEGAFGMKADFVIAGFGCAGACAAIEAADLGLSVIILEKEPEATAGGNLIIAYGSYGSPGRAGLGRGSRT